MKIHCEYDKMIKLKDLVPHPLNPNVHSENQLKKLARIIKYFGWRKCVTVSKQTNYVIRGHGRYEAARLAGLKTVPVNYQYYASNDDELADLVADNKISEMSEFNDERLEELVDMIGERGFDIELTGFDISDFSGEDVTAGRRSRELVLLPYIFTKEETKIIAVAVTAAKSQFGVDDEGKALFHIINHLTEGS